MRAYDVPQNSGLRIMISSTTQLKFDWCLIYFRPFEYSKNRSNAKDNTVPMSRRGDTFQAQSDGLAEKWHTAWYNLVTNPELPGLSPLLNVARLTGSTRWCRALPESPQSTYQGYLLFAALFYYPYVHWKACSSPHHRMIHSIQLRTLVSTNNFW
jgi:hypothetical protein